MQTTDINQAFSEFDTLSAQRNASLLGKNSSNGSGSGSSGGSSNGASSLSMNVATSAVSLIAFVFGMLLM